METKNIKYPYLPEGRTILYVAEDNKNMLAAKEFALKYSTDKQVSTGAVVVADSGEILASAANQTPIKNKFLLDTHKNWCIRKFFKIPSGQKYWLCPGCASHKNHGEYRAVVALQKKFPNQTHVNCDLYLYGHWWCCKPCWDKMIEVGIRNVYLMQGVEKLFTK
jgi:deoxycytidylate deaminase